MSPATKDGAKRKSGSTPTKGAAAEADTTPAFSSAKLHREVTQLEEREANTEFDSVGLFSGRCQELRSVLAKVLDVRTGKTKAKQEEMNELRMKVMENAQLTRVKRR